MRSAILSAVSPPAARALLDAVLAALRAHAADAALTQRILLALMKLLAAAQQTGTSEAAAAFITHLEQGGFVELLVALLRRHARMATSRFSST
jgi:hypothetical protein